MCLTTWTVCCSAMCTGEDGALIQELVGMEEPVPIEEENLPQQRTAEDVAHSFWASSY